MKKVLLGLGVALLLGACSSTSSTNEKKDTYAQFVEAFSDSTAYAIVNMNNDSILLVSNEFYQNEDEQQQPILTAIAAQLYGKDAQGKIVSYGEVRSQGTNYPLSMSANGILTAGHHYVNRYALGGKPLSLQIVEDVDITYDKQGNASSSYENREQNIYRDSIGEQDYEAMMTAFDAATPIVFKMK